MTKKLDVNDRSLVHLTLILLWNSEVVVVVWPFTTTNSHWVVSEKHCETTKSLKICYLFNISQEKVYHTKISNIDELKRRINSERAALSHTVIECALG